MSFSSLPLPSSSSSSSSSSAAASSSPPKITDPSIIDTKITKLADIARLAIDDTATHMEKDAFTNKKIKYEGKLDIPNLQEALEGKLNDTERQKLRALLAPPGSTPPNKPMTQKGQDALARAQMLQDEKLKAEQMARTTKRVALVAGIALFAIGVGISATGWGAIVGVPLAIIGLGIAIYYNKEELKKFGLMAGTGIVAGGKAVGKGTVAGGKAILRAPGRIWGSIKKAMEKDKSIPTPPDPRSTPRPSASSSSSSSSSSSTRLRSSSLSSSLPSSSSSSTSSPAKTRRASVTAQVQEPNDPELQKNVDVLKGLLTRRGEPLRDAIQNLGNSLRNLSATDATKVTTQAQQDQKQATITRLGEEIKAQETNLSEIQKTLDLLDEIAALDEDSVKEKMKDDKTPFQAALDLTEAHGIHHKTEEISNIMVRLIEMGADISSVETKNKTQRELFAVVKQKLPREI